jgi:hypothetical protein
MKHPTFIAIKDLDLTAGTQLRAGLDKAAVADYAEGYREFGAAHLGSITIYHVPGLKQPYVPVDGFHRISAAREVWPQDAELPCVCVGSGSLREAILRAAGVNAEHGVRRTDADKRRAVLQVLSDAEWVNWSDNKIAKICNVGNRLVGVLRRELVAAANTPQQSVLQLSPRLASLSATEAKKAIEVTKNFSQSDRIVERNGTTFTQKSPATERPPQQFTPPLLQDLRIYVGPRRLDAKASQILDEGDIVEFLGREEQSKLNNVAIGLGIYVRHADEIRDKWLEPIPCSIGDIVPAADPTNPVGEIFDYLVIGGTAIDLKFVVNFGEYKETLGLDEIADRITDLVEQDREVAAIGDRTSIPTALLSDELLARLCDFLHLVWRGNPYQYAIAPTTYWLDNKTPRVIDYRQISGASTPSRDTCEVAIVSQFTPNLSVLADGCRQLIITPCNAVILCYDLPGALVTKHFNSALGCLKI